MLEILFLISAKKVVVFLAFVGALLVSLAPKLSRRFGLATGKGTRIEEILIKTGYSFVALSVALFIIAGFIIDLK
jgi:hypothetical protein